MADNLQGLTFTDQSNGDQAKNTKEIREDFCRCSYHSKTQPKKTAGNFPNFFEEIFSPDIFMSMFHPVKTEMRDKNEIKATLP